MSFFRIPATHHDVVHTPTDVTSTGYGGPTMPPPPQFDCGFETSPLCEIWDLAEVFRPDEEFDNNPPMATGSGPTMTDADSIFTTALTTQFEGARVSPKMSQGSRLERTPSFPTGDTSSSSPITAPSRAIDSIAMAESFARGNQPSDQALLTHQQQWLDQLSRQKQDLASHHVWDSEMRVDFDPLPDNNPLEDIPDVHDDELASRAASDISSGPPSPPQRPRRRRTRLMCPSEPSSSPMRGEKVYVCEYEDCPKVYSSQSSLSKHKKTHSSIRPFVCSHAGCGRAFILSAHLTRHAMIHTGEKPFACPECKRRFLRSDDLRKHILVHTGERPHVCGIDNCEKSFARVSALRRHQRTLHP